jgi:hypothetical protein
MELLYVCWDSRLLREVAISFGRAKSGIFRRCRYIKTPVLTLKLILETLKFDISPIVE